MFRCFYIQVCARKGKGQVQQVVQLDANDLEIQDLVYLNRLELHKALITDEFKTLMRISAVDITEVALAAGYDTQAAFGKAFKQQFGLSPSEFRQLSCNAATQILLKGNLS